MTFLIGPCQNPATMHLPSPLELKGSFPLSQKAKAFLEDSRSTAKNILESCDERTVVIMGPCSIDSVQGALAYAEKLKKLQERVKENCFLVMRAYFEKPRTLFGWKGFIYDPRLDGSDQMHEGLKEARSLLLNLAERQIPVATEFLDPLASPYIEDLITWGFIGARTSASPIHRQLASLLNFPIGFKNSLNGELKHALNAMEATAQKGSFFGIDETGHVAIKKSQGNPLTHIVLRGSDTKSNCDKDSILYASKKALDRGLCGKVLVDCAHGNAKKDVETQKANFLNTLNLLPNGKILGFMLESYLEEGCQSSPNKDSYGISLTDPCLSWNQSEELILALCNANSKKEIVLQN